MPLPHAARTWSLALAFALLAAPSVLAAEVRVLLPLQRAAYQTDEWIDVSVARSGVAALPAGTLTLTLTPVSFGGGAVSGTFEVPAVPVAGKEARRVEHLHVNGRLLRPGKYRVEATVGGATGSAEVEVVSHVRRSTFRTVNWGRAGKEQQLLQGEDGFGFNLFYGDEAGDNLLHAGVDSMGVCVMSGAHQMDLRMECDWSDPLVTRGGTRRVVRRALADRTRPNVVGVHFYDEPGLTWHKNPVTGENTPHGVPAQVRSFQSAFDADPPRYEKLDPKDAAGAERWRHWATWKLGFMDAAWRESQHGVSVVRPDYLSLTQSQYGWTAFTDGYYFNVARSLPVTSGHGGYHDYGPGFFNPSFTLEMARARDGWKPNWYLPCWYGNTTSDQFRLEQYLAFQTGIQGMISPPDLEPAINPSARAGIVETNGLFQRLGPVFTTMRPTKPPVAMLYSLSSVIHDQIESKGETNYAHATRQGQNLAFTYLAGKLLRRPFHPVLDEDVRDGSLAADHKVLIVTSVDYLDPKVVRNLEDYVAGGGTVLLTADCKVAVKGAKRLAVAPAHPDQGAIDRLQAELKTEKDKAALEQKGRQLALTGRTGRHLAGAAPLAKAIGAELDALKIAPVFESDIPTIVGTRQGGGDVEYLFAVNATPDDDAVDEKGTPQTVTPKAAAATLRVVDDGRPVYDALVGGECPGLLKGEQVRFGPGQMRVFARTARPLDGVRVAAPTVARDLVREQDPIRLKIAGAVVDVKGDVLSGSFPLHLRLTDPLGATRYELYRATEDGVFSLSLPLAANDAAGRWAVAVQDLLSGKPETVAHFDYAPPTQARAVAGATPRAASFGDDRAHLFRFARAFHEVTVVKGKSAFNDAAARRLAKALEPWGVVCKAADLTEAAKARPVSEAEAPTLVGLAPSRATAGDKNPPVVSGFNVRGPVILLGNPGDNPLIEFLAREKFLPYAPDPLNFPGPGRGYLAWQRDGVGAGQESVTLIADDEAGMAEAVGSFYEAVAGLEPLTRWELLDAAHVAPATSEVRPAALATAWEVRLPDRIDALRTEGKVVVAASHDGSITRVTIKSPAQGKAVSPADYAKFVREAAAPALAPALVKKLERPDRMVSHTASAGGRIVVAYWGGTVRVTDGDGRVLAEERMPRDVTAVAWLGGQPVVGLADGRVLVLDVKPK